MAGLNTRTGQRNVNYTPSVPNKPIVVDAPGYRWEPASRINVSARRVGSTGDMFSPVNQSSNQSGQRSAATVYGAPYESPPTNDWATLDASRRRIQQDADWQSALMNYAMGRTYTYSSMNQDADLTRDLIRRQNQAAVDQGNAAFDYGQRLQMQREQNDALAMRDAKNNQISYDTALLQSQQQERESQRQQAIAALDRQSQLQQSLLGTYGNLLASGPGQGIYRYW